MNNLSQKSFRIVRIRPYSCEGGCIVYVDIPDGIWNAAEPGEPEDLRNDLDSCWEEILDHCQEIRGCIYPVLVLSADGRRLLRVRGLSGTLLLPEGVEEVADDAATCKDDNRIYRIVWNGTIRRIGNEAFLSFRLDDDTVALPPTVEFVGDRAFDVADFSVCVVSSQCHCGDIVGNRSEESYVCRYKNYRRFLEDMAWIKYDCEVNCSVVKFVRDVRSLLENFDGDLNVLPYVVKNTDMMEFLSSYWILRRLKELDGPLSEALCTRYFFSSFSVWMETYQTFSLKDMYVMLILEDDTTPRKSKVEVARKTILESDGGPWDHERALPLCPLHLFYEDRGHDYPVACRSFDCAGKVRDHELLDAIDKDAASRFMMRVAVSGVSVKKKIMAALIAARASSCIAAVYAHYPKTEQMIPLNDLVLNALSWPVDDVMSLIDAVEREMPGRISKVRDALGNNALWYLLLARDGSYYLLDGRYRFGDDNEKIAKRLVELGTDPFETTPTGLSWYEIAIGEDDMQNNVVVNPRIAFLSMLKKRMMDMGEFQDVP